MRSVEPDSIRDHFVHVGSERFPPKQVIHEVTGLDRADFTTNHARAILKRLGFSVGRIGRAGETAPPYLVASSTEALEPHRGRWVLVKDGAVLRAGDDPVALIRWLKRSRQRADSLFRVPADPEFEPFSWTG